MVSLPSKERFRCEILSWNRVVRDTIKLSKSIIYSGFKPDIVVAIGREVMFRCDTL
jgi:hypoxanthine phosphoribosyltransferase